MSEFVAELPIESDESSTTRWFWSHLRQQWLPLMVMFAGAFGNALLAAALPILTGVAFNAVLEEPADLTLLGWVAIAIIASQVIRAGLQLGRNFASALIGERLERGMRQELYVRLLGKSTTFHDLQSVGETMARATNDVHEVNLLMFPGINLVVGSLNFLIMPVLLAPRYHWSLILAPLFFLVTYTIAVGRYLRVLQPIAAKVRETFGRLNSRLAEAIDGVEMVKSTAQESAETEHFSSNAAGYRDAAVAQGRVEARFLPLLLMGLAQGIGFAQAMYLLNQGEIQVGDVVAYMGLLALLGFPTFISLVAYSRVSLGMAGARRVLELITAETNLDQNSGGYRGQIEGTIEFDNVSHAYVDGVNVLQDISFVAQPGQTIAVVGQTGSGKSTLTKLLNRTYDVGQGQVKIDGVDVRDWDLDALRRQISIIEQDIFLFSRSVADNIAFGRPDATRDRVESAARAAQAHDFILNFRDGYDTIIGERGVTLSGGQRQRLALARAFLTDPQILILDDSTSAVDSATEDQIQQAIQSIAAGRTTILITHRLSQIRWADKVLVLRKGRLEASGNHETLMKTSDAYHRIFEQYEALDDQPG